VRPGIKETFDEEIEEKEELIVEESKKETEVKKDIKINDEKTKIVEKKNNG